MLANYLKLACKVLLRRKFYTAVSLFGIAFTLMVLMLCTALVDEVFTSGYPERKLHRMLGIEYASMRGPQSSTTGNPGYALLDRVARDLPGVELFSIVEQQRTVVSFLDGRKIESILKRTDGEFWEIMDFEFQEGGPFTRADERQGSFVAVINETTRRRFFGDGLAAGRDLPAGGQTFRVVGVVRDVPQTRGFSYAEIWVPISTSPSTTYRDAWVGSFAGIVLAEDRSRFAGIREELALRLERVELPDPDNYDTLLAAANTRFQELSRDVLGVWDSVQAPTFRLGLLLAAAVALFISLPAVNLVNLNLSRILERSSEIGVRKAFGGSPANLVGQFLVENVLLTLIGGALGLALAFVAMAILNDSGAIPYLVLRPNLRVFFYGFGLSLLFGVVSGAYPAWRMSRMHPVEALHGRAA